MGHGSYQSSDWSKLKSSRNITSSSTVSDLYKSKEMPSWLNPYGVKYRESCDSMDNPASTAIIIGLDVTGSMGYLSEEIAKNALNRTMLEIYEKNPVTNPHIMFQAIGDSKSDRAPLQVTQFEADIRIAEQLLDVYFEGRGGGNDGESYLLSWYFASRHTKIDCYEKRKKKGFLFTIGDECCHGDLTSMEIRRVFGEKCKDCTSRGLYQEASKKYEIFHIVMKAGSYRHQNSGESWKALIGNRAIELDPEDLDILPELLVGLMQRVDGKSIDEVVGQWKGKASEVVKKILVEAGDFVQPDAPKGTKNFLNF
ncbi:MAG: hypothetical protein IJ379_06380 [Lachnospiraceae bacterium]|nr:hypothetical protein [Lachnospiraceae bacterium]